MAIHQEVMSRLERRDAVVAKAGGTTPDDHVTMSQRHAARPVGSTQSPRRKTAGSPRETDTIGAEKSRSFLS